MKLNKQLHLSREEQFVKMTASPLPKLIVSLSIPTVISMMITAIYNMADTFFVSQLGESASAAVGIVFPIMSLIQCFGFVFAIGASSLVSRKMGEKNDEAANMYASTAFFSAMFTGLIIMAAGLSLLDPVMKLIGATPTNLPYARAYGRFIFLGAPFMCASFVMNNVLRAEGRATLSMIGLSAGGILNIALDPLFIFAFGLGTAGAAIATVISQIISFSILAYFYIRKLAIVRISFKGISRRIGAYIEIIKLGLPSLFRQGLMTLALIVLNTQARVYGDAAISAFTINGRIFMLILSVVLGIGQGFTPVCGYNYGARLYDRVRKAYWFTVKLAAAIVLVLASIGVAFAPGIVALFIDSEEVIRIGAFIMRLQCIVMVCHPFLIIPTMLFQATGRAFNATFLSTCRQGTYFLPLIFLLPHFFGLRGVQVAQSIADILSFLTGIPLVYHFFRKLKKQEEEEREKANI